MFPFKVIFLPIIITSLQSVTIPAPPTPRYATTSLSRLVTVWECCEGDLGSVITIGSDCPAPVNLFDSNLLKHNLSFNPLSQI